MDEPSPLPTPSSFEIAGVSLRTPQRAYRVETEFGAATWSRTSPAASICRAELRLQLNDATAKACASDLSQPPYGVPATVATYTDLVNTLYSAEPRHSEQWRRLIVEHRLLGRPNLFVDLRGSDKTGDSIIDADPQLGAALRELHDRHKHALGGPRYGGRVCAECLSAFRLRQRTEAELARSTGQRRYGWDPPKNDCPHLALAHAAIKILCNRYDELVFELVEWLAPERVALDGDGSPLTAAPQRFVLTAKLMIAVLSHLCLGRAPDHPEYGYHSYADHWHSSRRTSRVFRYDRKQKQIATTRLMSAERRAILTFAASAWAIPTPVEELTASVADSASLPQWTQPETQRLRITRILPESDHRAQPKS